MSILYKHPIVGPKIQSPCSILCPCPIWPCLSKVLTLAQMQIAFFEPPSVLTFRKACPKGPSTHFEGISTPTHNHDSRNPTYPMFGYFGPLELGCKESTLLARGWCRPQATPGEHQQSPELQRRALMRCSNNLRVPWRLMGLGNYLYLALQPYLQSPGLALCRSPKSGYKPSCKYFLSL